MTDLSPFHLAIPVSDLDATLVFYEELLGCTRGRESNDWIDLNFWGHQLVLHRVEQGSAGQGRHQSGGWRARARTALWRGAGLGRI